MITQQELINNRYILKELIGEGAMGIVYRAYDRLTDKDVAVKRLNYDWISDPQMRESKGMQDYHMSNLLALTREFRILSSLRHPNIISVLNYGIENGQHPFFVMDYLSNAKNFFMASRRRTINTKLHLLMQVLQALAYLHRHGILHRDLKMDNILVVNDKVQVLDFGLSVQTGQAEERSGTIYYMAPETLTSAISVEASDLYSVGVIAYEIFANALPFEDFTGILFGEADMSLMNVPQSISDVIARLLLKNPEERYQSAEAVIQALQYSMESPIIVEAIESAPVNYHFHTSFVGRSDELQILLDGLKQAKDGIGSMFLIGGEYGIGKSRLLAELRTYALVEGMQVIFGSATPGITLPYQLWRDIIPQFAIATEINAQEASILAEIAPDILQLLGHDYIPVPDAGGSAAQHRLIASFTTVIRSLNKPTVLLLEDIQWIKESMVILQQVAKLVKEQGLVIIATYNSDEAPDLLEQLPQAQLIQLNPLVSDEIKAFCNMILGEDEHQQLLIETLEQETQGKPLLIVEMLRLLTDQVEVDHTQTQLIRIFEKGIQRMIDTQLRQIPEHLYPVLRLAAILGRNIHKQLIESQLSPNLVNDWMILATQLGILTVLDERSFFTHERTRLTVLENLSDEEAREVYQQAANAYEQFHAEDAAYAPILSEYWQKIGDNKKAFHYAQTAAQFSFARGLLELAHDSLQEALNLRDYAEDSCEVVELELLLGEVYTRLGKYDEATAIFDAVILQEHAENSSMFRAKALTSKGWIMLRRSNLKTAQEYCVAALELAKESADPLVLALSFKNLGYITMNAGKFDEASSNFSQGLEQARKIENIAEVAALLNGAGLVYFIQGLHREASQYFEECLTYFEQLDDRWNMAVALHNLGGCLFNMGEYELSEIKVRQSLDLDRSINDTIGIAYHLTYMVRSAVNLQNFSEAHYYQAEIEQIRQEISDLKVESLILRAVGWMYLNEDELDESVKYLQQALDIHIELAHQPSIVVSKIAFAWVALLRENWQETVDILQENLDMIRASGDVWTLTETLITLALAKHYLGDESDVEAYLKEAMTIALRTAANPLLLEALLVLAIVRFKSQSIESVAWYHLILKQPALRIMTQQIANRIIDGLIQNLSPEHQETALHLADELDLDAIIQSIVGSDS